MANLKAIRKRRDSVKSTQKITRAMKMVAAARLRRAQERILELRPYALRTLEVLSSLAARTEATDHALLARRPGNRVMLLVLTSDRGLCGGFNMNINRAAERTLRAKEGEGKDIGLAIVGRKGRDYFRRRGANIFAELTGILDDLNYGKAERVARMVIDAYAAADLDACYIVYNEFKSAMTQRVVVEPLLPIVPLDLPATEGAVDFIYEPAKRELLERLLPMYVETEIYRALLESNASEFGARMTAMEAATTNANEMIERLTLEYNRARQAAITKELMEIIGGAEALKG